jgi:hypothetical protein
MDVHEADLQEALPGLTETRRLPGENQNQLLIVLGEAGGLSKLRSSTGLDPLSTRLRVPGSWTGVDVVVHRQRPRDRRRRR